MNPMRISIASALLLVMLAGCSKVHPVKGQVVFEDGAPAKELAGYLVSLRSEEHKISATAVIQEDGSFTVGTHSNADGAMLGKHQVAITPPPPEVDGPIPPRRISERYGKFESSNLEIHVVNGQNTPTLKVERIQK